MPAVLAALSAGCAGQPVPPAPAVASSPATGGSSAPASPPTAAATEAPTVPESVLLPDEGERSEVAEFTDWTTDPARDRAWLLDPCRPTAYPTDGLRTRFRTVERTGPEAHDARQLAVYPTTGDAAEVLAGFRRVLAACSTGGDPAQGNRWTWVSEDVPDLGDDGLLAASTIGGPGYSGTGARIAVTRTGNAVFLAYATGEYNVAAIDDGARSAREVALRFLD